MSAIKAMSAIHVLDDSTINKIAAGEVVERPASVIKELVENSIDAGAKRIEVEVMAGGTSFMRVMDDGHGMGMEDAKLAVRRHATSKIREADDLHTVHTLGFRGEALPTIASVSRFQLLTRLEGEELGTRVSIIGGQMPDIREAGCNIGTSIQVEDLFFNTPARKKFLKTNHTEGAKISDLIAKLALSHPGIAFRFINNNKTTLSTPGNGSLFDAIQGIYGGQVAKSLLALEFSDEDIRVTGYITKPSMLKSSRGWQTFMVNRRVVGIKSVAKAIDNAYHSLLSKAGFPMVAMNIEVPQRTVDVNVHPRKSEVKFEDEGRIFKAVYKAVVDAIRPAAAQSLQQAAGEVSHAERHYTIEPMHFVPATEPMPDCPPMPSLPPRTIYEAVSRLPRQGQGNFAQVQEARQAFAAPDDTPEDGSMGAPYPFPRHGMAETAPESVGIDSPNEGTIVPIGQVDRCYIIAQDIKGLYIIDQHAAHERILYDKFSSMAGNIPSQQLLIHQFLDFDEKETERIEANLALFNSLGFAMEPSGERQFRLKEIPADIPASEAEDIIREILASLHDMHKMSAQEIRHACLATTACRAAIKAGDELSVLQMQLLLEELSKTARPYTCPHGRPTILKFGSDELAKMFKRTGF